MVVGACVVVVVVVVEVVVVVVVVGAWVVVGACVVIGACVVVGACVVGACVGATGVFGACVVGAGGNFDTAATTSGIDFLTLAFKSCFSAEIIFLSFGKLRCLFGLTTAISDTLA